jgi:hypothetical protein
MSWLLVGSFSCALAPIVGLGFLKRLVTRLDPDWQASARARGQFLVHYDLVGQLGPTPSWPRVLTLLLGAVYLAHYVLAAIFFFVTLLVAGPEHAVRFGFRFALANSVYFVLQVCLPVSPPWRFHPQYQTQTQTHADSTFSPEAGLATFDAVVGTLVGRPVSVCAGIYQKSHWFEGAFPSGHVLWPCTVALQALDMWGPGPRSVYPLLHLFLVALAAMHFCHHYAVDCLAAVLIAGSVLLVS